MTSGKNTEILNLAKKLIFFKTTQDNPLAFKKILLDIKPQLTKFTSEEFLDNDSPSMLFYNQKTRPEKFKIIFNAHLDVVPGADRQFIPFEKDGKLYGRGSYDMKAAAAAMILAFKNVAHSLSYPCALQLVTDEEIGGFNGTKHQIDKGVRSEFVVAGENTDFKISNKAKGIIWAKIMSSGKTAHGAYPWLGENAILNLQNAIDGLLKLYPIPKNDKWQTTVNIASIDTSNKTYNKIPDEATALLDIRYIPEDSKDILVKIQSALPNNTNLVEAIQEDSQYTPEDNPYLLDFKNQVERFTNTQPELIAVPGGSDVRFYEKDGTGTICFGPIGAGHHSDDEWVDIESLEKCYQIYKNFLLYYS